MERENIKWERAELASFVCRGRHNTTHKVCATESISDGFTQWGQQLLLPGLGRVQHEAQQFLVALVFVAINQPKRTHTLWKTFAAYASDTVAVACFVLCCGKFAQMHTHNNNSIAVACKRPQSFCQKCRWQVTPRQAYTLDPTKSEWADYAAMDWSWPKEWN